MERFVWGHNRRYNDYSSYIKRKFGCRVQKISVNVGFSCPNRDGSKGVGGCIYCNNKTFKPGYCKPDKSITEQVDRGIDFFSGKYPQMQYMAYFQSYTNTYAPLDILEEYYTEAISHKDIKGLIIGTRPDCVGEELLQMLGDINKNIPVTIEFGLETTKNETLEKINRCHTWEDSVKAILMCKKHNIETGGHLILGLPSESKEDMLSHAIKISALPIKTLKLHQLQITKGTNLASLYIKNPSFVKPFTFEEYKNIVISFVEHLNPNIIIERFVSTSPIDKLIAPHWNKMKNFEVVAEIEKALKEQNTWQGKKYK